MWKGLVMAKRIVSWVMAVVLAFGMGPGVAFGDEVVAGEAAAGEVPAQGPAAAPVVSVAKASSTAPGQLVVKVGGDAAQSYQMQVSTASNFKTNLVTTETASRTHTFKKLKKGVTYRVRVRAKAPAAEPATEAAWGAWSAAKSVRVQNDGTWKMSKGYATYVKPNGKLAHGLTTIGPKTYLFDGKGRQKVGWQRVKGAYRFFNVSTKAGAYMVKSRVVNGIKLKKDGTATYGKAGLEELEIMVKAQKLAEKITKPSQSQRKKLELGFDWMLNNCKEQMIHHFGSYAGWHRTFANEIYDLHNGSCFSYGAAYAYFANAIGYKSCRIVSSGGHGWAEIDGDVYDIEWTRHRPQRYFAWPYSKSGYGGAPGYASARIYVVQIAPKTSRW